MAKQMIPVYVVTGFLEAGKTTMVQGFLSDSEFNDGCKILLLVCEEGEEEYDPTKFWGQNVHQMLIEKESDLTEELIADYLLHHKVDRVMVEYNGMWQLSTLYNALPDGLGIYQQIFTADASTILSYNANMRSLVVDKLQNSDTVIFNRAKGQSREELHKLVRGISRAAQIAYEDTRDADLEFDEIEDPLPFDKNAPVITVEDKDFALFYRDLAEDISFYDGKTVKFKGMVHRDERFGKEELAIGRFVMTCCEADIAYNGLLCEFGKPVGYKNDEWLMITAKIKVKRHAIYGNQAGPVLYVTDTALTSAPSQEVATFY